MRSRAGWAAGLAALVVLLTGCSIAPTMDSAREQPPAAAPDATAPAPAPVETEDESAPEGDPPTAPEPTSVPGQAAQNAVSGLIYVQANSNTWEISITTVGRANLAELVMYDTGEPAELPSARQSLLWVCFDATQTSGFPGSWAGDDFRFEVIAENGTRYDHLTAIDYAMADDEHDLYFAQGNDLDETYVGICTMFLVPRGVDASNVAVLPDDGVPLELEIDGDLG